MADRTLARLFYPLEVALVRTVSTDRVIDAITETVRQDGVVHGDLATVSLGHRKVFVGRHPVARVWGDRLEMGRSAKLLRAEAFGHLACELGDVTLLGSLNQDSLYAE